MKRIIWAGALGVLVLAGCGSQNSHQAIIEKTRPGNGLTVNLPDEFAPQASAYPFAGSRSALVFHKSGCPEIRKLVSQDKVFFRNPAQARAQGFKPCPQCRPEAE